MPDIPSFAVDTLKTLLTTQHLAVVATTRQDGHPYTSLVAFVASEDLQRIVFVTSRATTKYRNLSQVPDVSLLIDSRTHADDDLPQSRMIGVS